MKTYYAPGLIEWLLRIRCGDANIYYHFTKDRLTPLGKDVATYTTDNPADIAIIENSIYFKRGEIRLAKPSYIQGTYFPMLTKPDEVKNHNNAVEKPHTERAECIDHVAPTVYAKPEIETTSIEVNDTPTSTEQKPQSCENVSQIETNKHDVTNDEQNIEPSIEKTTPNPILSKRQTKRKSSKLCKNKTKIRSKMRKKQTQENGVQCRNNKPIDCFAHSPPRSLM